MNEQVQKTEGEKLEQVAPTTESRLLTNPQLVGSDATKRKQLLPIRVKKSTF